MACSLGNRLAALLALPRGSDPDWHCAGLRTVKPLVGLRTGDLPEERQESKQNGRRAQDTRLSGCSTVCGRAITCFPDTTLGSPDIPVSQAWESTV